MTIGVSDKIARLQSGAPITTAADVEATDASGASSRVSIELATNRDAIATAAQTATDAKSAAESATTTADGAANTAGIASRTAADAQSAARSANTNAAAAAQTANDAKTAADANTQAIAALPSGDGSGATQGPSGYTPLFSLSSPEPGKATVSTSYTQTPTQPSASSVDITLPAGAKGDAGNDGGEGPVGYTPQVTISDNGNGSADVATTYSRVTTAPVQEGTTLQLPRGEKGNDGNDGNDGAAGWGIGSATLTQSGNDVTIALTPARIVDEPATTRLTFTVPSSGGSTSGQSAAQVMTAIVNALNALIGDDYVTLTGTGAQTIALNKNPDADAGIISTEPVTLLSYTLTQADKDNESGGAVLRLNITTSNSLSTGGSLPWITARVMFITATGPATVQRTLTLNAYDTYNLTVPSGAIAITVQAQVQTRGFAANGSVRIVGASLGIKGSHEVEFEALINALIASATESLANDITVIRNDIAAVTTATRNNAAAIAGNTAAIAAIKSNPALAILQSSAVYDAVDTTLTLTAGTAVCAALGVVADPATERAATSDFTGFTPQSLAGRTLRPVGSTRLTASTYALAGPFDFEAGKSSEFGYFGATYDSDADINLITIDGTTILRQTRAGIVWAVPTAFSSTTTTTERTIYTSTGAAQIELDTVATSGAAEVPGIYSISAQQNVRLQFHALANGNAHGDDIEVALPASSVGAQTLTFSSNGLDEIFQYRVVRSGTTTTLYISEVGTSQTNYHRQLFARVVYTQTSTVSTPAGYTDEPILVDGQRLDTSDRVVQLSFDIIDSNLIITIDGTDHAIDQPTTPFTRRFTATTFQMGDTDWTQIVVVRATSAAALPQFAAATRILPASQYAAVDGFAGIFTRTMSNHQGISTRAPDGTVLQMVEAPTEDNQVPVSNGGSWQAGPAPVSPAVEPTVITKTGNDIYIIPDSAVFVHCIFEWTGTAGNDRWTSMVTALLSMTNSTYRNWNGDSQNPPAADKPRSIGFAIRTTTITAPVGSTAYQIDTTGFAASITSVRIQ